MKLQITNYWLVFAALVATAAEARDPFEEYLPIGVRFGAMKQDVLKLEPESAPIPSSSKRDTSKVARRLPDSTGFDVLIYSFNSRMELAAVEFSSTSGRLRAGSPPEKYAHALIRNFAPDHDQTLRSTIEFEPVDITVKTFRHQTKSLRADVITTTKVLRVIIYDPQLINERDLLPIRDPADEGKLQLLRKQLKKEK
jgi:hypothetical protein